MSLEILWGGELKGRGEGSRICTKLLLSHKAAKLPSPADSNRRLITPAKVQMVAWMRVADLQSSALYALVLHFIAQGLDTKWKSGPGGMKELSLPRGQSRPWELGVWPTGMGDPSLPSSPGWISQHLWFCPSLCFLIIRIHIVFSSWPTRWYNLMLFHPLTQILHYFCQRQTLCVVPAATLSKPSCTKS